MKLVARAADGSMRDALSLLDQAIAYGAGTVMEEEVRTMLGSVDRSRVVELIDTVAAHDAAGALEVVAAVASDAADYADVLGELANTLHRIAVCQAVPGAADPDSDVADACARLAERLSPEDVQLYYEIAIRGRRDLALVPDPRLGLEMTVLRMLAFTPHANDAAPPGRSRCGRRRRRHRRVAGALESRCRVRDDGRSGGGPHSGGGGGASRSGIDDRGHLARHGGRARTVRPCRRAGVELEPRRGA